ncbi:helix-turn-helix domain-containing protein [Actinosynnema mirum]|uniref:Transcriptional regulator, XRE family n=1 Tax=Actinosynnema mirum (strain ATCC 29888 / DSM 43827 / JCM 3225 / NBRC 14064 / NCIMB 13271 / NRRL B-12336 / IMRU 3971 / 101) TaxID=446462 RepID=C6WB83_ACTMD|nr:helix-turn-helix transcriptional regulator [Actinosynnema mirum]ACU39374.1 transcriptional regulator, XRE family [Actinosynnema mirum DSM 43827]
MSTRLTRQDIRPLRLQAGYTQHQLAAATGLSRNTIRLIEAGAELTQRSEKLLRSVLAPTPESDSDRLARIEATLNEVLRRLGTQAVA